jgi:hypothetical protein
MARMTPTSSMSSVIGQRASIRTCEGEDQGLSLVPGSPSLLEGIRA